EPEPLESIALDHLHDRSREELTDVTQPARDPRCRHAEAAATFAAAPAVPAAPVVQGGQRAIHADVAFGQALAVVAAERKTPAAAAFVMRAVHGRSPEHA